LKPPAWTVLLILLGDVAGASAAARARPAAKPPASDPSGPDVSAAYSFLRAGEANLHGVDVSASFRFRPRWRLLGDLSLHSGSFAGTHVKQANFMAGARRLFSSGRHWQPFVQALLGGAHSTTTFEGSESLIASQTSWGGALGLGTDYRLSPHWAIRGQGDYFILHSSAGWDGDPRLSLGLAYRFPR
jgi:outer membrane receptor protein involved in Fe transport